MKILKLQRHAAPSSRRTGGAVSRYTLNNEGRDFIVGDIHGMFSHLRHLLQEVHFKPGCDRLFSVGDLIDRGPESSEALDWLALSWFHACRGNHEQFAIDSVDPEQLDGWVRYNGGEWWLDLNPADQERFREIFARLPMAMEIETNSGNVGIVHADVPVGFTWEQFTALLEAGNPDAEFYALWSRGRIQGVAGTVPIEGHVERVYCGHTPTRGTVSLGNVYFIDTGAAYCYEGFTEAKLTLVEIQPTRHREYTIYTGQSL